MLVVSPKLLNGLYVGDRIEAIFEAVLSLDEMLVPEGQLVM